MTIEEYLLSLGLLEQPKLSAYEFLLYDVNKRILRRHLFSTNSRDFNSIQNPSVKLLIKLTRLGMITTVG